MLPTSITVLSAPRVLNDIAQEILKHLPHQHSVALQRGQLGNVPLYLAPFALRLRTEIASATMAFKSVGRTFKDAAQASPG